MGVAISSREELVAWLEDKPRDWAQVIALRCALRVLPIALDPQSYRSQRIDPSLTRAMLRALAVSSGAAKISLGHTGAATFRAARAVASHAAAAMPPLGYLHHHSVTPSCAVGAAEDATAAATAKADADAYVAIGDTEYMRLATRDYAVRAADAAAAAPAFDITSAWQSIGDDCGMLERGDNLIFLLAAPLWSDGSPDWFPSTWERASAWLDASPDGFAFWRQWYERKLFGERFEFAHLDETAEREFFARLFAQDDEWWSREPAIVNAEIANWVAELARPTLTDAELEQNPTVVSFALDAEGRTILAPEPLPNGLQNDPDARDTHAEIRRLINLARQASAHGSTQATDMVDTLDLFDESVGLAPEDVRPRLFVLRGKELIRQVEVRQRDDPVGLPLSAQQINVFAPLIAAIRQCADEDSKLRKLWLGPDSDGPVLTRGQIEVIVAALGEAGQTTAQSQEPIVTAAGQVQANASENDPARRTASEMVRNVFRSIGKGLKKADEGSKSADRWIKLAERVTQIWMKVRQYLPDDEFIARLLDWISKGGGSS